MHPNDIVRAIHANPRRLDDLVTMLEDADRCVRNRAAAALAALSDRHPFRFLRFNARLKDALKDDSAYVRWHLVYVLDRLCVHIPLCSRDLISDIAELLEDNNRIVRIMAAKSLARLAAGNPEIVENLFLNLKKDIPSTVARFLHKSHNRSHSQKRSE